jgi:hypothetical protein
MLNNSETMNTLIDLSAMVAFVLGMVAFYCALTYDREIVLARLRRKR